MVDLLELFIVFVFLYGVVAKKKKKERFFCCLLLDGCFASDPMLFRSV